MKWIVPLSLVAAGGFVLGACGASQVGYADWVGELGQEITAAQSRSTDHAEAVHGAGTIAAVHADEDSFFADMETYHDRMLHLSDDMETCHDAQGHMPMHMDAVHQDLGDLHDEIVAHHQAMLDATDLPAAEAEEDRFQAALGTLFEEMDTVHEEMMGDATDFECPAHDDAWMDGGHMMGWWDGGGMMGGGGTVRDDGGYGGGMMGDGGYAYEDGGYGGGMMGDGGYAYEDGGYGGGMMGDGGMH